MKANIIEKLKQLHLSESEAKVYVALVKFGQTSAGPIIKKTNLHRSVVYESLHKLVDRKLANTTDKNKIAYFQAADPTKILEEALYLEQIAQEVVPELKNLIDFNLPQITVYEGLESYRQYWLEAYKKLPIGSIVCISGSIGERWQEFMGRKIKEFDATRKKRKIKWQMIVYDREDLTPEQSIKSSLTQFRLVNQKVAKRGNFNILDAETLVLHSAEEPMIIEIKNKSLAHVFRDTFEILWSIGKPAR